MATTKVKCVICGHKCRVMAYYGDKVCSQRCSEQRRALGRNGFHAAMKAVRHVDL